MKKPIERNLRLKQLVVTGVFIIVSWMVLIIPLASLVILPVVITAIVLAVRWRSMIPLAAFILNPLTVSFSLGVKEWFADKPTFRGMGLPGNEFFNLDRATRCYRSTGGCVVNGNEWVYQAPHNLGLKSMTILLGAPRSAYKGPYPAKTEAIKLTDNAPETPPEIFLQDKVLIDGVTTSLMPKTADSILSDFGMIFFDLGSPEATRKVRACLLANRCLLIRVSLKETSSGATVLDDSDGIVLFDSVSKKAFARYIVSGERAQRIPRLLLN